MRTIDDSEQNDENISSVSWDDNKNSVMFHCKTLNDVVVYDMNEDEIIKNQTPCEVCDSHGNLMIKIKCDCSEEHQVIIKVW